MKHTHSFVTETDYSCLNNTTQLVIHKIVCLRYSSRCGPLAHSISYIHVSHCTTICITTTTTTTARAYVCTIRVRMSECVRMCIYVVLFLPLLLVLFCLFICYFCWNSWTALSESETFILHTLTQSHAYETNTGKCILFSILL